MQDGRTRVCGTSGSRVVHDAPDPRPDTAIDRDLRQGEKKKAEQGTAGGRQHLSCSEMTGPGDLPDGTYGKDHERALQGE